MNRMAILDFLFGNKFLVDAKTQRHHIYNQTKKLADHLESIGWNDAWEHALIFVIYGEHGIRNKEKWLDDHTEELIGNIKQFITEST